MPAPFRLCLQCGVSYATRERDFGKLTTLGSEGRSTATTVLSLSAVRHLRADETLEDKARKPLDFRLIDFALSNLVNAGYTVRGFDPVPAARDDEGAAASPSPSSEYTYSF
jgi:hypothetical protein